MRYIVLILAVAFCTASCNDWLDVRPDTEQKEHDQFSTVDGFFGALTGCYMTMADNDLYGRRMTMSDVEALANLWEVKDNSTRYSELELSKHTYDKDNARKAIAAMYNGLFNVIVQANMIIKYADKQGDVFVDESMRKVVQGEAYAIRAYCQLDVLRLFGQMPQNAQKQVQLPYSFTTSIFEMPAYYGFADYVELLKKDVAKALELLKDNDPLFEHTFAELTGNPAGVDSHLAYRRSRLNYWAVKALEARMLLYAGDKQGAYTAAKAIIDGKGADGKAVLKMSGTEDIAAKYMAYPRECLFYMSKHNLQDQALTLLIGGSNIRVRNDQLAITDKMFKELYEDVPQNYLASHNRYRNVWGTCADLNHNPYRSVLKYWWEDKNNDAGTDSDEFSKNRLYRQVIPMLRMSEVYLIAIETAPLADANTLCKTYMEDRAVAPSLVEDFASETEVNKFILNEYRREFYAEGQMFYTYKRRGETAIKWYAETVSDDTYVLPLPETEYNPNL